MPANDPTDPPSDEAQLLHELHMHQTELEMQNEQLRHTQLELELARDRYFELYDLAPIGYVTLDAKGGVLEANLSAAALLGLERGALIGKKISSFMSEADADRFCLHRREVSKGPPQRRTLELGLRRADGRWLTVQLDSVAANDHGGTVCHTTLIDRTEKRVIEDQLHQSLERFQQIADHLSDVFYIAEARTWRSLYISPAFQRMFGLSAPPQGEEQHPRSWLRFVHPQDRDRLVAAMARAAGGSPFIEEYRITRADGAARVIRHRAFPISDRDRITGILQDVTEERQMEDELRHAQRMSALGTLASGISHDFNNLLMGISGCANLALKRLAPGHPACVPIRQGLEAAMRGANLTKQLLRFADRNAAEGGPTDLDSAVAMTQDLLQPLVGEHIQIVLQTSARGFLVRAAPAEIEEILLNLASNACDAMLHGGTLTIRTELRTIHAGHSAATKPGEWPRAGRYVVLTVADTGSGMDAATRVHIFEPFYTTKEVGQGTGLGLSTVFAALARLGGHITVDSEVGKGTTFALYFPVVAEEPVLKEAAPAAAAPITRGSETVLLVEDEPLVRMSVQATLETLGYRVLVASDGWEAARLCGQQVEVTGSVKRSGAPSIDMLLTDVMMPGELGSDLAVQLQKMMPGLPVLFMSAHPRKELVQSGRLPSDAQLITKPFDEHTLSAALRRILDGASDGEETPQATSGRRILLVDDNVELAASLADIMQQDGYEVQVAHSGPEALHIARSFLPAVVLCDLSLTPEMSGYDVARTLRADAALRGVRLVAVTGFTDPRYRKKAVDAGFDLFLHKPFPIEDLETVLVA